MNADPVDGRRSLSLVGLCLAATVTLLLCGCGGGETRMVEGEAGAELGIVAATAPVVSAAGEDTGITVSTPALNVAPGAAFDLPVSISERDGVAGYYLNLAYDNTALSCEAVENGDVVGNENWTPEAARPPMSFPSVINSQGRASISVVSLHAAEPGSGTLAVFRMRALAAPAVVTTSVEITGQIRDANGNALGDISFAPAPINIVRDGEGLVGDLKGTEQPDIGSVQMILKVVLGQDPEPPAGQVWKWDCNGTGDVDLGDAIVIMRCLAGLRTWPLSGGGIVKVSVDPPEVSLKATQSVLFRALVSGTSDTRVQWEVVGGGVGVISSEGWYTAPKVTVDETVYIKATSLAVEAGGASGLAKVTVVKPLGNNNAIIKIQGVE